MEKHHSRLKIVVLGLALLGVGLAVSRAAAGSGSTSGTTAATARPAGKDGNGVPYRIDSDRGYKVFQVTQQKAGVLAVDEAGTAPTCGQAHLLCLWSNNTAVTGNAPLTAAIYDTAKVASGEVDTVKITAGLVSAVTVDTGKAACTPVIDAQFNNGLGVSMNDTVGTAWVEWKPCKDR